MAGNYLLVGDDGLDAGRLMQAGELCGRITCPAVANGDDLRDVQDFVTYRVSAWTVCERRPSATVVGPRLAEHEAPGPA